MLIRLLKCLLLGKDSSILYSRFVRLLNRCLLKGSSFEGNLGYTLLAQPMAEDESFLSTSQFTILTSTPANFLFSLYDGA